MGKTGPSSEAKEGSRRSPGPRLDGELTVITGAGQGIGEAIARLFAESGSEVVLAGRTYEKVQRVADSINAKGFSAFPVLVDVTLPESIEAMRETVWERYGRGISIFVNNAAILYAEKIMDVTWERWQEVLTTNLTGAFYCCKTFAQDMIEAKRGSIIILTSVNGIQAEPEVASYNASKAGLILLTKSLAIELAEHSIRVNAIAPGQIETPLTTSADTLPLYDQLTERIPMGRWGKPEEVAQAALFLASDASSYFTGSVLVPDGGLLGGY